MFKLEPGDVFVFVNEDKGWTADISRWGIGRYGHAAMYVGFGFGGNVPFFFESTGRGCALHSLQHHFGELVTVMRPQINASAKQQVINNAIDLANSDKGYYDYLCIAKNCIPRVLKEKFPWLPIPPKYHRDPAMICSEAVAECYWRAGIEVLPEDVVPLPGDFLTSLIFDIAGEGRILQDVVP
jgi:hypothetical protein